MLRRLERASGTLSTRCVESLRELAWFRALDADVQAAVGLVVQAGIDGFLRWLRDPQANLAVAPGAFAAVPREVSRQVSLAQTVELVRRSVDTVEAALDDLAGPDDASALRESVLRYGRELAFATAGVYARAAEEQGAWHARVAAQLVDGLAGGAPPRVLTARASSIGWPSTTPVVVAATRVALDTAEDTVEAVRRNAGRHRIPALAGLHGSSLVVVLAADADPLEQLSRLLPPGHVAVLGPPAPGIGEAAGSTLEALRGLRVLPALPDPQPVVGAALLLPYRVLAGDADARARVVAAVHAPLARAGAELLTTVRTYLERASSIEECARMLFVHPNTVRYRLRRVEQLTGLRATDPAESFLLRIGLIVGRLSEPGEELEVEASTPALSGPHNNTDQ